MKIRLSRPSLLAGLVLLWVTAQCQSMSIRELRTLEANEKQGSTFASYYLVGVLEGLREAGDMARRTGQTPPFCIEGRRLEPSMARSLYQSELIRHGESYEADMPVQLVLAEALRNSFRCNP